PLFDAPRWPVAVLAYLAQECVNVEVGGQLRIAREVFKRRKGLYALRLSAAQQLCARLRCLALMICFNRCLSDCLHRHALPSWRYATTASLSDRFHLL